jgi:cytochrome c-type biogenesis protein CcmF
MVLIFFGFAGEGFKKEEQVNLLPGDQTTVGAFTVRHDALRVTQDAVKQMITGHVTIFESGKEIGTMRAARWFFHKRTNEPTTEVAIRRGLTEDLYVVLGGYDPATQQGIYTITVNPLVNWIWFGFAILALGTALTLMPESAFAFAVSKVPGGAATASLLLLTLALPSAALHAQGQAVQPVPRGALERQLEGEILCTCGCRRALNNCGMPNCHGHEEQTIKLRQYLNQGMDHDAIVAAFIKEFGGEHILSAPIDRGFNRLAWLLPYAVGTFGALSIAFAAVRWSRRESATRDDITSEVSEDDDLKTRLDDELRDLD